MNVIAIYGSARKKGNGAYLVDLAVDEFSRRGEEVKKYYLSDMDIQACAGCFACRKKETCVRKDDMAELLQAIIESDFVIFETPIYMYDGSGVFRMMLNRLYPMLGGEPGRYKTRYPNKKCMLIMTQGAPKCMFISARRIIKKIIKSFGFDVCSTISMGFANELRQAKKRKDLEKKIRRVVAHICQKK